MKEERKKKKEFENFKVKQPSKVYEAK